MKNVLDHMEHNDDMAAAKDVVVNLCDNYARQCDAGMFRAVALTASLSCVIN